MKFLTLAFFLLDFLAYGQNVQTGPDYLAIIPHYVRLLPEDYLVPKPLPPENIWQPKLPKAVYEFNFGLGSSPTHYNRFQAPEGFLPEVGRLNLSVIRRDRRPINSGFMEGMKHIWLEAVENTKASNEATAYYERYRPISPGGHTPMELYNYQRDHSAWGLYGTFVRSLTNSASAQLLRWFPIPVKFHRKSKVN